MPRNPKQDGNLKKGNPDTQFKSGREAVENGHKGGVASGVSKRARKTLRAELETLLSTQTVDPKTGEKRESTVQEAITAALVKQALKGNTKAFEIIRDTVGEKPAEHITLAEIDPDTVARVEEMVTCRDK